MDYVHRSCFDRRNAIPVAIDPQFKEEAKTKVKDV